MEGPDRGRETLSYVVVACAALLCYLPALRGGFIIDDNVLVYENALLKIDRGLLAIWASRQSPDYFPLTSTSFWIEWRLWGMNAAGYHTVNVLLHALGSGLVYRLLRRLAIPGALLAALLFAVHPINVPSVAWIAERKNTLSLPLYLLSALLFVRAEKTDGFRVHAAALGVFVLALLTKTSGVMVPFLFLAWSRVTKGRLALRDWLRLLPYFLASLALGLVTVWFQVYADFIGAWTWPAQPPVVARFALAGRAVLFYLGKILVPVDLRAFYPFWDRAIRGPGDLVPLGVLVLGTALLVRGRPRTTPLSWALVAMVVLLLPVLGFSAMDYHRFSWVADHWVHLPMIPLVAWLGFAAAAVFSRLGARPRKAAVVVGTALCLLLGAQTARRAHAWADAERFWRLELAQDPENWVAHSGLGSLLLETGRSPEAEPHAREALRQRPEHASLYLSLGVTLATQNKNEEARAMFREAFSRAPHWPKALRNFVQSLVIDERIAEAEQACRHALAIDPQMAPAHAFLAQMLWRKGELDAAMAHIRAAMAMDPGDPSLHRMAGLVLLAQGRKEESVPHFRHTLKLTPGDRDAQVGLARALGQLR